MTLTKSLNLLPALVLPIKELLVGPRVNLWAIQHLPMDKAEAFERHDHHGDLHLADGNHKRSRQLHIRYQHVYDIAESQLARGVLVGLAVVVHPVADAHLVLLLQARER